MVIHAYKIKRQETLAKNEQAMKMLLIFTCCLVGSTLILIDNERSR
jgi:hypothetical protein